MEFEIAEEDFLLERSNNPSLDRAGPALPSQRIVAKPFRLMGRQLPQKAVLIPEETDRI